MRPIDGRQDGTWGSEVKKVHWNAPVQMIFVQSVRERNRFIDFSALLPQTESSISNFASAMLAQMELPASGKKPMRESNPRWQGERTQVSEAEDGWRNDNKPVSVPNQKCPKDL